MSERPDPHLGNLPRHLLMRTIDYLDPPDRKNLFSLAPPPSPQVIAQQQAMMTRRQKMIAHRQRLMMQRQQMLAAQQQQQAAGAKEEEEEEEDEEEEESSDEEGSDDEGSSEEDSEEEGSYEEDSEEEGSSEEGDSKDEEDDRSDNEESRPTKKQVQTSHENKESGEIKNDENKESEGKSEEKDSKDKSEGPEAEKDEETKRKEAHAAAEKQRQRINPMLMMDDCDTLLAKLNTRRLYKRVRAYNQDIYRLRPYYRPNMTTEQIAWAEWNDLLDRARGTADPPVLDPAHELLLFTTCPRAVAILASYPRSGNSLMRTLFERLTLRVTGSDMRGGLAKHDLVGEMAVGTNRVQFVKTHFPERLGQPPFMASRVVLLVRNPYDALESYFNLMMTSTHTTSLSEEDREAYKQVWENMVRKEIQVWKEFHEYWLKQPVPLLLVRYEDLIRFPDKVMGRVVKHVLEVNNMTFFQNRIQKCIIDEQIENLGSYQPRSGGIGKSLKKYSPELLQEMNVGILSTMEKLEYSSMLIPNKEEWELEPLEGYGREYFLGEQEILVNNKEQLVRKPHLHTNWGAIKRQMMGGQTRNVNRKCNCYRCTGKGR